MHKDKIKMTLTAQQLVHVIDLNYVTTNPKLDKCQTDWFYSILVGIMLKETAWSIVKSHEEYKDTQEFWSKLCNYYDL